MSTQLWFTLGDELNALYFRVWGADGETCHSYRCLQDVALVNSDGYGLCKATYLNVLVFLDQVKRETGSRKEVFPATHSSRGVRRSCYGGREEKVGNGLPNISPHLHQ